MKTSPLPKARSLGLALALTIALAPPASALGLTDAQKEAIRAAVASEKEAILAVAAAEESARTALDDAVTALPADPARVAAAFPAVASADADLAALRARLYSKTLAPLTPVEAARANALLAFATERAGELLDRALARAAKDPAALPRYARLGLTPDQKGRIDALYAAREPEIRALVEAEKAARAALRAAIRKPQADEAGARAAAATVSAVDLRAAQLRSALHGEVSAVLSAPQAEKLTKGHDAVRAFLVAQAEAFVRLVDGLL